MKSEYTARHIIIIMFRNNHNVLITNHNLGQPYRLQDEGMRPLDNRAVMLSCFEAFRQFIYELDVGKDK
jgi:hypothetical protein